VVFEIDADEVEVEEELVVESDDGIEALDTLVVKPSKAFAQTTVPSSPAMKSTTVSPPVRSRVVISIDAPPPMDAEQVASAPGRMGQFILGAIKLDPLFNTSVRSFSRRNFENALVSK